MTLEAAFWSLVGVGSPLLARALRGPLLARLGDRAWLVVEAAPWLHGLAVPFAAVLSGAVPARFLGLYGRDGLLGWGTGLLLAGGTVLVLVTAARRVALAVPDLRFDRVVLDEPRWALYRGAGSLWLGSPAWGWLVGLALALAEWALRSEAWQPDWRRDQSACLLLARVAVSSLAFALTANLWLTLGVQLAWLAWPAPRAAADAA